MNIFVLDESPEEAARMQCDKHVVKMILESGQMLCSIWPDGRAPYKRAFYNHPCTKWVRESQANYFWLWCHAMELCREYTRRYEKTHATEDVIRWCSMGTRWFHEKEVSIMFDHEILTPFAQAMPDEYKVEGDAVQAYRNYYIGEKARFATWKEPGSTPEWFQESVCV